MQVGGRCHVAVYSNPPSKAAMPPPPVVIPAASGNSIVVSPVQRGNPVLEAIKNVSKEFGEIPCDYQVGRTTGVLFLSLKYHRLHPEYIHTRIEKLGRHMYTLRILLVMCDVVSCDSISHDDFSKRTDRTSRSDSRIDQSTAFITSNVVPPFTFVCQVCLINEITILVAFSVDEAGHYLSTLKQFEHKPPDLIKERVDKDYDSLLRASLTSISKVNKTDVESLRTAFGSFANISRATSDQLMNLPGFGQVKVRNIKSAFEKPIRNNATNTLEHLSAHSTSGKAKTTARREESPEWDIEQDVTAEEIREQSSRSQQWNIELDLN
ncbi:unnamed protein product [Mycena citricolor]|uniref:ERCC1-like central domain-containing protein n=1 Tax=Mycena citricolor TaxID=2018698 RepID=A0AAD2HX13_9AGAR|nr:unnamed protein product [Mycena citricolor]